MKNRIRELRQSYGITQTALAKYLGVAQNTLSYWEQGKYDIDNASLQKIADYFKCSVDYVLCRETVERTNFTENTLEYLLNDNEQELIHAYRKQKNMQEAVCRLLGIKVPNSINSQSDCEISKDMCDVLKQSDGVNNFIKQK